MGEEPPSDCSNGSSRSRNSHRSSALAYHISHQQAKACLTDKPPSNETKGRRGFREVQLGHLQAHLLCDVAGIQPERAELHLPGIGSSLMQPSYITRNPANTEHGRGNWTKTKRREVDETTVHIEIGNSNSDWSIPLSPLEKPDILRRKAVSARPQPQNSSQRAP